ncbi:hypothetical protein AVEN_119086-1 [Araneus ventricosus]|uniref:Uncharacterized protein n=1 Tax=Araneus ventricosus TaxID=182803 RepID=A0A4Y2BKV4_ARAVE|nr:hypothetical protein AVEN_119086-1 [Araneus ventricosus]
MFEHLALFPASGKANSALSPLSPKSETRPLQGSSFSKRQILTPYARDFSTGAFKSERLRVWALTQHAEGLSSSSVYLSESDFQVSWMHAWARYVEQIGRHPWFS